MPYEESTKSALGAGPCTYYAEALKESEEFRANYSKRKGVVKCEEMPWENSPQGRIKHVINEKMDTRECCLDMYIQELSPGGRSGKHCHMAEEVFFVLEGKGYDLHWDVEFDCNDEYTWGMAAEPSKWEWEEGDFVYIPPYTAHQHFNADPEKRARIISAANRVIKALGFDWLDQLENAPEYKGESGE